MIIIIYITVPVTITPAGDNNVVDIIGESHTSTYTTDSSRPAALIQ